MKMIFKESSNYTIVLKNIIIFYVNIDSDFMNNYI
jgi:hypothetical protein